MTAKHSHNEQMEPRCTCGRFPAQTGTGVSEGGVPTVTLACRTCDKQWTEDWG